VFQAIIWVVMVFTPAFNRQRAMACAITPAAWRTPGEWGATAN
jgi:hypothetical protein